MDKLKMMSMDKVQGNIEKIRTLFPNAVTEVLRDGKPTLAVDFDVLKQELADTLIDDKELRYQFTWPDKQKSILLANTPINKTLRPCKEESVDFDTTQNLYIEGDNLEVLKLLQETYLSKIKMIYIDPPYNTGNDFVYNDDFAQETGEYIESSGQFDDEGNNTTKSLMENFKQNLESNGRFHTDWLNMIYPRLRLAKDLLSDDGVIFISINEYEYKNLSKLCEELFSAQNHVCTFTWETKKAAQGMTTANMVVDNNEYVVVYAKNIGKFKFRGLDRDENNGFSNPDNDPRGLWKRQYLQRIGQGLPIRTIVDPCTGNSFSFETPYTQDKLNRWIKEGRIIFPSDTTKYPARKEFLNEYENKQQLVTALGLFATKATTEKLYSLFDDIKIFTNPKPDTLTKFLVQQCTNGDSLILDFFSGSATTAHAVMQLNAEDGGRRKFIMVQLPEPCDEKSEAYKAGYKNICEIGKERIRRAGKKIKDEIGDKAQNLDIGFRVLKLDSSNMKDVYYKPEEYSQILLGDMLDNIKPDRTALDLLFQIMLELGKPLSAKITQKVIADKNVFNVDDGDLIACFEDNITTEIVTEIAKAKPLYAVFRDSGLSSDSVAANFEQIFAIYSPNTKRKVL